MSLINDALKRATSKQITTIPIPPEPAPPMQPVEHPPRRRGLPWYFFPALLAIMAAACWFVVKGVQARQQAADPAAATSTTSVKARELNTDTPAPSTASSPVTAPVTVPVTTAPATPAGVSSPTTPSHSPETSPPATETPAATPTAAPEPVEPPKATFRLQGIFYRQTNPSALINGKSVWVGSRVDGATVKAITRDTLTIEFDGQTKQLTLE